MLYELGADQSLVICPVSTIRVLAASGEIPVDSVITRPTVPAIISKVRIPVAIPLINAIYSE
jgi:hypothetical protein